MSGYACDMFEHIDYVIRKSGEDYVAFGSDMVIKDSSTGAVKSLLQEVPGIMYSKGYSQQVIDKICYLNLQRVLKDTL